MSRKKKMDGKTQQITQNLSYLLDTGIVESFNPQVPNGVGTNIISSVSLIRTQRHRKVKLLLQGSEEACVGAGARIQTVQLQSLHKRTKGGCHIKQIFMDQFSEISFITGRFGTLSPLTSFLFMLVLKVLSNVGRIYVWNQGILL